MMLEDYDNAIFYYNQAIKADPKFSIAYNNLGITYKNMKKYDEAIMEFTKAIDLDPDYVIALNNRGVAKLEKGD